MIDYAAEITAADLKQHPGWYRSAYTQAVEITGTTDPATIERELDRMAREDAERYDADRRSANY